MKINWKIRILDQQFWLEIVPAVLLLVQVVAQLLGFELNLSELGSKLVSVINAVFVVLTIIGVVRDPTTPGMSDSERAMQYVEPGVLPPEA